MIPQTADEKAPEPAWEEAVALRRLPAEGTQPHAEEVTVSLKEAEGPDAVEVAASMRRPVDAALEDLRRDPHRAASLLAPAVGEAVKLSRRDGHVRRAELLSMWCLLATRPRMWGWAINALWDGEPVWSFIEQRAGWYEVPELVLSDSRTRRILSRAETLSHRIRPGEARLEEVFAGSQTSVAGTETGPAEGLKDGSRVMVLVAARCKLAARVRGRLPAGLRESLQGVCEEADAILDHVSLGEKAHTDMLQRLLRGALVSPAASTKPRGWVLIIGALAFGCLMVWLAAREYRWRDLVQALDNEPGLRVLQQDSSWGRREIRGLRDPMARLPEDVVREMGMERENIALRFKTYLSADEPFVTQRAMIMEQYRSGPVSLLFPESQDSKR